MPGTACPTRHRSRSSPLGSVPFDPNGPDEIGWAEETTLDVEWAHAMAPKANIVLLTSPVDETEGVQGLPEFDALINYALDHHLGASSPRVGAPPRTGCSTRPAKRSSAPSIGAMPAPRRWAPLKKDATGGACPRGTHPWIVDSTDGKGRAAGQSPIAARGGRAKSSVVVTPTLGEIAGRGPSTACTTRHRAGLAWAVARDPCGAWMTRRGSGARMTRRGRRR